jgi:peptidoglycan/LPS O-acetylase OafA/YrhL
VVVLWAACAWVGSSIAWPIAGLSFSLRQATWVFASGALVLAARGGAGGWLLGWRPLVYLGSISYGIYVWHAMIPAFVRFPAPGLARFLWLSMASIVMASLSWYLYERPILRLKERVPYMSGRERRDSTILAIRPPASARTCGPKVRSSI